MRVKTLTDTWYEGKAWPRGKTLTVDDETGRRWVLAQWAKEEPEAKPPKAEQSR